MSENQNKASPVFSVRLLPNERQALQELTKSTGKSRNGIIRELILLASQVNQAPQQTKGGQDDRTKSG